MHGHVGVVEVLLADPQTLVDQTDNQLGYTALHCAALSNELATARLLLEKGSAKVDQTDNEGRTSLHLVGMGRPRGSIRIPIAQLLLENGASKTVLDNTGRTPAQLARDWGNTQVAKIIIDF